MAHDQFQIPTPHEASDYESSLNEVRRIADSFQYTPETQPEAFQYIKDIESRIRSYRDEAVKAEVKKSFVQRAMRSYAFGFTPKSPLETLIDKEAIAGSTLFKNDTTPGTVVSRRFWYHDEHRGKGEWYFEEYTAQKRTVLQFQTTASSIEKLADGVPVPFTADEFEMIAQLPALYEQKVRKDVYGKDDFTVAA